MTSLAAGILGQRSETELFFMEALNEVSNYVNIAYAVCGVMLMLMLMFTITINGKRRNENRVGAEYSKDQDIFSADTTRIT